MSEQYDMRYTADDHAVYGPITKVQALSEVMAERAHYYDVMNQGGYNPADISLLGDALDSFGMSFNDISDSELSRLADIEGDLDIDHSITSGDDESDETEVSDDYSSEEPEFWEALHDKMDFRPEPDPNLAIKRALAPAAFVAETLASPDWILKRNADGTVGEQRQLPDGTFEERGES